MQGWPRVYIPLCYTVSDSRSTPDPTIGVDVGLAG